MGEAKWKADYGEPWKTVPSQSSARLALIEERHGLQGRFLIADDMAERIVACVNALSSITNVEALGAFLAAYRRWRACRDPLNNVGQCALLASGNTHSEQIDIAYDALYAPQASEAKP